MADLEEVLESLKADAMAEPTPAGRKVRNEQIHLDGEPGQVHGHIIKDCVWCKGDSIITMDVANYVNYSQGTHAQHVWPNASAGDRETFISGTHSQCFDEMFPPDEEEE